MVEEALRPLHVRVPARVGHQEPDLRVEGHPTPVEGEHPTIVVRSLEVRPSQSDWYWEKLTQISFFAYPPHFPLDF